MSLQHDNWTAARRDDRAVEDVDVRTLPETAFGLRNLPTWATIGFMVIEGSTLAIAMGAYLYLKRNFSEWPPPPTPLPDLLIPSINALLLLATMAPMVVAGRAARALSMPTMRVALVIATLMSLACTVLRGFEFAALNTRWDSSAYGSVVWVLVGLHSSLLAVDLLESIVITALTFSTGFEQKHYTDVEDAALYQCFLSLSWVPIYLLVFLLPRWS
jgi:heme/copper-type cytochrome/quinol oxidase subunit 3